MTTAAHYGVEVENADSELDDCLMTYDVVKGMSEIM